MCVYTMCISVSGDTVNIDDICDKSEHVGLYLGYSHIISCEAVQYFVSRLNVPTKNMSAKFCIEVCRPSQLFIHAVPLPSNSFDFYLP